MLRSTRIFVDDGSPWSARRVNTADRKPRLAVAGQDSVAGVVRAAFAKQGQVLLPMLELIENARTNLDELMSEAARGCSSSSCWCSRHMRWLGPSIGVGVRAEYSARQSDLALVLAERELALRGPRLRRRGAGDKEGGIPAYERLQAEPRLGERIHDIMVAAQDHPCNVGLFSYRGQILELSVIAPCAGSLRVINYESGGQLDR